MNSSDFIKIIKLSLGSILAIFIAGLLKLEYSIVAGIITLLTVKSTKKETLKGVLGKVYGFILCTLFSYIIFNLLGFSLSGFSIYIFIVIFLCFLFKIQDVIAMCIVIASHYYLQGQVSSYWILNEFLLFIIGAGIGMLMNLYIPSNLFKIYEGRVKLQEEISDILKDIGFIIINPHEKNSYTNDLGNLNSLINLSVSHTYENINNNLLTDTKFLLDYIEIIKDQRDILENIYQNISNLNSIPDQAYIISDFIYKVAYSQLEFENINILLEELNLLMDNMKNQPLPTNRNEFENRAILFLCLVELKKFLGNYLKNNGCYI